MRILLVNTTDSGGAGIATFRLYHALKKAGAEVRILLQKAKKPDTRANPDVKIIASDTLKKIFYYFRTRREHILIGSEARLNFSTGRTGISIKKHPWVKWADVVHLHWINDSFVKLSELQRLNKPLVWTLHDMWPYSSGTHYEPDSTSIQPPVNSKIRERIWSHKKTVYPSLSLTAVCPSEWLANLARRSETFASVDVNAIPNPIDTSVYRPLNPNKRNAFGISEDKTVALFGSFNVLGDERKGFAELSSALQKLHEARAELNDKLEIAVIGRQDDAMADLIPYPVHFLGFHSTDQALVDCYSVADFFVIPSKQDNLPNMCLEAVACGLPVVGFNIGGVPDMVIDGKNGFLVEAFDTSQMADAIYRMAVSEGRETMSGYGRQHVLNHFAEEVVAKKMMDLYQKLPPVPGA